jgi:branched-chain amino acid transport system substrate-binding protein
LASRPRMRKRRRRRPAATARRWLAALLALALGLAGCEGDSGTGDEVRGTTLSVYVSAPLHGPRAADGQAIVDGAKLALAESGGEIGDLEIEAVYLDDSGARRSGWDPVATADNARQAAEDVTAIAYIGELDSGATRTSLPITNQAGMAQISPGSTAVDLTRTPPVGPGPDRLQPSDENTFVRIPPADDVQAHGAAQLARRLGVGTARVLDDRSAYGTGIADEFIAEAAQLGIRVPSEPTPVPRRGESLVGSPAEALYYGGTAERARAALTPRTGAEIGSDALLEPPFLRAAGPIVEGLYLTSSFIDPSRLPPAGQRFVRDYRRQFGRAPLPAAAYGYEAMALLLDGIRRAGDDGDDRATVTDELFATRDRGSILGTYSVLGSGDTTLDEISVYRVGDGVPAFEEELRASP